MPKNITKSKNVQITERDYKIMQFLFEHKVATRDQIGKYFFSGSSKQCVNSRLNKLLCCGLIQRVLIQSGAKITFGYSLEQKGLFTMKAKSPYDITGKSIKSECNLHDTTLVEIRRRITTISTVIDYYTENVLQTCNEFKEDEKLLPFIKLNSDAVISLETKIGIVHLAIEYDSSRKSKERYKKKIEEYYQQYKIQGILYICESKYILNCIHKVEPEIAKRHQSDFKMYYSLLDNVLNSSDEIIFKNVEGYLFKLK